MNTQAEKHLAKAEGYLAKGEAWYRKAADEMRAAKNEGAIWPEIGDRLGRSKSWCERIVAWAESPANDASAPTPFAEPGRDTPDVRGFKRVLAEAPMEQIETSLADLSPERRAQFQQALHETHPALTKRPPLGVGDNIRRFEENTSFVMLMGGSLSQLTSVVELVQDRWERFEDKATDEEKDIVQEQIRDAVASLLSINSDPQELLR